MASEYFSILDDSNGILEIHFFGERKLLRLIIRYSSWKSIKIMECTHLTGKEWRPLECGIRYGGKSGKVSATVSFPRPVTVGRIRLHLTGESAPDMVSIEPIVCRDERADLDLLVEAFLSYDRGDVREAADKLRQYCKMIPGNGLACLFLARWYEKLEMHDQAEFYAIKAAANKYAERGMELYREIQARSQFLDLASIRELQSKCRDWQAGDHHGAVAILQETRFRFGMDGWYVKKFRALVEIRRELAARLLSRCDISFTNRNMLIKTDMRIIHSDDSVEVLPRDRFSIGDSHNRNVYIEDEIDKLGTWILPDLAVGDIIEWSYQIAYPVTQKIDETEVVFVMATSSDTYFPMHEMRVEFRAPADWNLRCVLRNCSFTCEQTVLEDTSEIAYFVTGKQLKSKLATGFRYEGHMFNPVVACASGTYDWKTVATSLRQHNIGDVEADGSLPSPIDELVRESPDAITCMQRAFYWVRDKIKYGAFVSADTRIGSENRLQAIVDSGFGDCKDKSYVLSRVAARLGLPYQFVLVSLKHGITVEELPSDQFDHMFLRVKIGDVWHYLESTSRETVFGLPQIHLQGLQALALDDDGGEIITLPFDDPSRNSAEVRETLVNIENNQLVGQYEITARGRTARQLDEQRKALSLQISNPLVSVAYALSDYAPDIELKHAEHTSQTGNSDVLAVHGQHRRCELSRFEGDLVGTLEWAHPTLPLHSWKAMTDDSPMVFPMPLRFDILCVIEGDLFEQLLDYSTAPTMSSDLCEISSEISRESGRVQIRRSIIIKTKFVSDEQQSQVSETMANLRQAFRMTLKFRNEAQRASG